MFEAKEERKADVKKRARRRSERERETAKLPPAL